MTAAARKSRAKLSLVKSSPQTKPPVTRPAVWESEIFRKEQRNGLNAVEAKIKALDAAELDAENALQDLMALENGKRETERTAQAERRSDLIKIRDGYMAALDASGDRQHEQAAAAAEQA